MNESPDNRKGPSRELLRAIATDGLVTLERPGSENSPAGVLEFGAAEWVAVLRFLDTVAGILRDGLPIESMLGVRYRRDVRIELTGRSAEIPAHDVRFGFRIRVPGDERITVAFDPRAVEAISSVFLPFYAPIRGYGDPTQAEIGVLEFAVLLTLAELHRESIGFQADGALESFLKRSDLLHEPIASGLPLEVRLSVDHLEGRVTLFLPQSMQRAFVRVLPPPPRREVRFDARAAIDVRLALPSIVVPTADWKGSQLGDILMLGLTDLEAFATDCSLVSLTHWRLGPVTIDRDSPSGVSVIVGEFDPQPFAPPPFRDGDAVIHPLLGAAKVTLDRLENWRPGERFDLQKSAQNPVSLFFRGTELARGELVMVDGEIGVRLTVIFVKEIEP